MPFVLRWECVYNKSGNIITENVKDDAGKRTFAGIDEASHPHFDYVNPTLEKAMAVYWQEWQKFDCEHYPFPLGEVFFNCTVNCGIGRANKILALSKDARVFLNEQEAFYKRLVAAKPKLKKFLNGWINRIRDLRVFLNI